MSNPLLEIQGLPPFAQIKSEHVKPAMDTVLKENRARIEALLAANQSYTWENLVQPLEEMDDKINRMWSAVSHMNAVINSDALREAYNACLPKLSDYATEMGQHEGLHKAFMAISESDEYPILTIAQRKIIDNALRDFRLSGVSLSTEKKARFKDIKQDLSRLTTKFEENILDATQGWHKHVLHVSDLAGLPKSAIAMIKQAAEQKDLEGWVITLDFPIYYAVMNYADSNELRQEIYTAYVTRASEQGPTAGKWDNSDIMEDILRLRHEQTQLLDYKNYAQYSLATKMVHDTAQVLDFLEDLAKRSHDLALQERHELEAFAHKQFRMEALQAWDMAYYSEKLRQYKYAITQEELKPYFPETRVISGMFDVVKQLYGLNIKQIDNIETWHEDVRFYEIYDIENELRGKFYLDLYARTNKRGGAWMDDCISRKRNLDGSIQVPVAYLTCNLSPPVDSDPALFTHDEVITLFHEFGHGLHHMLTRVDYLGVSGISGVPWDAVELPSQFMENWCWERQALDSISGHYKSGEPLPEILYTRMYAAKNFQAGMQMARQLEFTLFDFRLHMEYDPHKGGRIQEILDDVRDKVAVITPAAFNRFQHSFAHIFAGGYAAGYYSYKWAEVLSADAFSKFEETGIFDRTTGHAFMETILEQGGSREPMELFIQFRGRKPKIDALLRHNGITG